MMLPVSDGMNRDDPGGKQRRQVVGEFTAFYCSKVRSPLVSKEYEV